MCCPTHCASYCVPCQPLLRAFSGWMAPAKDGGSAGVSMSFTALCLPPTLSLSVSLCSAPFGLTSLHCMWQYAHDAGSPALFGVLRAPQGPRRGGQPHPPWRQPRGESMVSSVNSHTNATRFGWHLWEIDLRFAPGLPPGWPAFTLALLCALESHCSLRCSILCRSHRACSATGHSSALTPVPQPPSLL